MNGGEGGAADGESVRVAARLPASASQLRLLVLGLPQTPAIHFRPEDSTGFPGCDCDNGLRACRWTGARARSPSSSPRRTRRSHLLLAGARGRLAVLLDPGTLEEIDLEVRLTLLLRVFGLFRGGLRGHCFRVGWTE